MSIHYLGKHEIPGNCLFNYAVYDFSKTRSSAIAEGPLDMLVSTNLATTKHPILK